MSTTPSAEDQKQRVLASFNALASSYDIVKFVQLAARRLLELADLQPGTKVLDVGTGTGLVAITAAQMVGPTGKVVGIDLSPEMIARARPRAADAGIANVEFREGDAEHLDFPDGSFDAVLYASSLFFVPDMLGSLREARRVLTPSGRVAFTAFTERFMYPLREMWEACLQRSGIPIMARPDTRLNNPANSEKLLHEAGFKQITVQTEALGYFLPDGEARWKEIESSLDSRVLQGLTPAQREQLKTEHLAELEALTTPQGIWFDVTTNFALGQK